MRACVLVAQIFLRIVFGMSSIAIGPLSVAGLQTKGLP